MITCRCIDVSWALCDIIIRLHTNLVISTLWELVDTEVDRAQVKIGRLRSGGWVKKDVTVVVLRYEPVLGVRVTLTIESKDYSKDNWEVLSLKN